MVKTIHRGRTLLDRKVTGAGQVLVLPGHVVVWLQGRQPLGGVHHGSGWLWQIGRGSPRRIGTGVELFIKQVSSRAFFWEDSFAQGVRWHYRDLAPPRTVSGCPLRHDDRVIYDDGRFLVSRLRLNATDHTDYEAEFTDVIRACDRVTGSVHTLAGADSVGRWEIAAHAGPWLALLLDFSDRYDTSYQVRAADMTTGATYDGHSQPGSPRGYALLANGNAAWIQDGYDYDPGPPPNATLYTTVQLLNAAGQQELDRATTDPQHPAGKLADLGGTGETLTWTHDGQPRRYDTTP